MCISLLQNKVDAVEYSDVSYVFSDTSAKFLRTTISFVMSVRLSTRNNSPPTGRIFMKFDI